jgi:hypothetical protein
MLENEVNILLFENIINRVIIKINFLIYKLIKKKFGY